MKKFKLDAEEQELVDSFEKGEWNTVENLDEQKEILEKAAAKFMKKEARINIRVSHYDLDRIKQIAVHEGLPYQTLIASILHKFADARLAHQ